MPPASVVAAAEDTAVGSRLPAASLEASAILSLSSERYGLRGRISVFNYLYLCRLAVTRLSVSGDSWF